MGEVEALEIPPGETVRLAPGGMHVMFMGLDAPLTADGSVPATLVFETAGEIEVEFRVEPRDAAAEPMDDMHMDH
jgi:copper(I)-binding protein